MKILTCPWAQPHWRRRWEERRERRKEEYVGRDLEEAVEMSFTQMEITELYRKIFWFASSISAYVGPPPSYLIKVFLPEPKKSKCLN